jgi:hypothetical protein
LLNSRARRLGDIEVGDGQENRARFRPITPAPITPSAGTA